MAAATDARSETLDHGVKDGARVIPGTTFAQMNGHDHANAVDDSTAAMTTQAGPLVNGQPTTATLYTPSQIAAEEELVAGLRTLVNHAFSASHEAHGAMPGTIERLQTPQQLVSELGSDDNATFSYILTSNSTNQILATASGKRWTGKTEPAEPVQGNKGSFIRYGAQSEDSEQWELSTMAVDPSLQRQGLAVWLMGMVEEEIRRRWEERGEKKGLVLLLTTLKEINGEFYAKRGYVVDYEKKFPPGWLQSVDGFSVAHMSRRVV